MKRVNETVVDEKGNMLFILFVPKKNRSLNPIFNFLSKAHKINLITEMSCAVHTENDEIEKVEELVSSLWDLINEKYNDVRFIIVPTKKFHDLEYFPCDD